MWQAWRAPLKQISLGEIHWNTGRIGWRTTCAPSFLFSLFQDFFNIYFSFFLVSIFFKSPSSRSVASSSRSVCFCMASAVPAPDLLWLAHEPV
jgi:hypothetical protein